VTNSATDIDFVNLASLNLVHDELLVTIEQSAVKLEQFSADLANDALLQVCTASIKQVGGTLKLVQLVGADLLAYELLALVSEIRPGESEVISQQLTSLSNAYFLLPRYIEYTLQTGHGMPVLLLDSINELRHARKVSALSSAYFFSFDEDAQRPDKRQNASVLAEDFSALVRRFRHMYQVALLNVFKGKQVKPSLAMMQRAIARLSNVCGARPISRQWWVASVALEVVIDTNMQLSKPRKMLLGALDRQIKKLQAAGPNGLDTAADGALLKELVYLVALSGSQTSAVDELLRVFKADKLNYNDAELRREMEILKGPSGNTLSAMATVLADELREVKGFLEHASLGGMLQASDCQGLVETLRRVGEILALVGLTSAAYSLKPEIAKIEMWGYGSGAPDAKDMIEVADVLLYVESSLASIDKLNLSDEKLTEINNLSRREVMANSQLVEAQVVVFEEAEAGLALVKRALSSFSETDYDRAHINNVAATLTAVRGGMSVLNLQRAANVISSSVDFIEQCLLQNNQPAEFQQLLETFADAVISIEYYLDAAKSDMSTDESVLEIAEESLSALGFAVSR
jgi:hypothetical protein